MACQAMHMCSFSELVGAFLDLAIAFHLLCASAIVFLASKFLSIFGLSLPCPCNGLFGNPNPNLCLQRLLLDCPIDKVYSVHLSTKSKFPMDSILGKAPNLDSNMKLLRDENDNVDGFVELGGGASCSSISQNSVQWIENGVKERRFDVKGKGVMNRRSRLGISRRRKGGVDYGKFSISSTDKEQNARIEGSSVPVDFGVDDDREAPMVMNLGERVLYDFELNQPLDEAKAQEKNALFVEGLRSDPQGELVYDGHEKNVYIELEKERNAALYVELEKERNAAASAADEAMAMILRLQEEKATIAMEARQYKRVIEEKTAYDAEEMNILKEILLRREREKYFLEKEVEVYRQIAHLGNEQLEGDVHDMVETQRQQFASSLYLTEDPDLMLHQLSESIDKKKLLKNRMSDTEVTSIRGNEFPIQGWDEDADLSKQGNFYKQYSHVSKCSTDGNQELQEKEMVFVDNYPYAQPKKGQVSETYLQSHKPSNSQQHNFLEKTIPIVGEEQKQKSNAKLCQGVETETVKTLKDQCNLMFDKESWANYVHDVHVIDDESNLGNEVSGSKRQQLSVNDVKRVCPSTSRLDTETDINRSSSEMAIGLPPMGSSERFVFSGLRRNSMSALDNERLKIDNEVGWLRERLRIVQEGREKLNLPVEHEEGEKLQLQLLEDIASQLREIRQLTEPGKVGHQASLPPPSSKVVSKKRRCRSASLAVP